MNYKIVVINGYPLSGKDTFIDICKNEVDFCLAVSTVDFVKTVAAKAGWNKVKDEKGRMLLHKLKNCLSEYGDIPFQKVVGTINKSLKIYENSQTEIGEDLSNKKILFFVVSREPEEIERFKTFFNATTLFIKREQHGVFSNSSDAEVENYSYDVIINNNNSLKELEKEAKQFVLSLF